MGLLHATSIVVALRDRRSFLHVLGFIVLASVLSAVTPWLGWFGNVIYWVTALSLGARFSALVRRSEHLDTACWCNSFGSGQFGEQTCSRPWGYA
jgi:hypothetical protein